MRRTILAILAGVVTSGSSTMHPLELHFYIRKVLVRVVPLFVPDSVFRVVVTQSVGMLIALPGVAVAVLLAPRPKPKPWWSV
ncbi:MAG: hypothetical protein GY778_05645 [bacterium]|nr:hypothetical protein [bacterium]